jgi:PAS domain S-box-containing protein
MADRSSPTILIVDDVEASRYTLARMLQKARFEVKEAATGREALRLAAEKPDLIILDVNLPDLSGYEVCKQIRAAPATAAIPVLHLSASFVDADNRAEGLEGGADGYLTYPVEPRELLANVGALLRVRRAEQEAREQRELLHVTLSSIGDAVIAADTDGRVTFLNPVAETLTGWNQDEAAGRPLAAVFPIVDGTTRWPLEGPVVRALREGTTVVLANNTILIARDGTERFVEDSAAPMRDRQGKIIGVVLVFRDVTQRKQIEAEIALRSRELEALNAQLRASQERLELAQEAGRIGIFEWDIRTNEVSWSATEEQLYGLPPGAFKGRYENWRQAVHPDDLEAAEAVLARAIADKQPWEMEFRIIRPDGGVRWIAAKGKLFADAEGRPVRMLGVNLDVTERKRVEEALRNSERLYRGIGESIDYGVWVCDPEGRNTYMSESFLRLVGLTQEQCSSSGWTRVLHPDDAAAALAAWQDCVKTGGTWDRQYRVLGVDGHWRPILSRGVAVRNDRGAVVCWAGINLDISRLKTVEEALRDADRRKDEFLATLAHELRNPLAPLRNGLQVLNQISSQEEVVVQTREMMSRQLAQMVRLIDDLLDISRITRGKIELRKERVELAVVVRSAVETNRPVIEQAGHELTVSLPPEPVYLMADPTRLAQIILNLLNNAARYTEPGGRIGLTVELADELKDPATAAEKPSEVVIRVRDNGTGIPAEMLPRIFEMFTQVDRSLERSQGGLGIGLTLVRSLVEMHGGTVTAHSDGLGRGSEFVVHLPLAPEWDAGATPAIEGTGPAPSLRALPLMRSSAPARRILVVDDNRDAALSLALLLQLAGYQTHTAHDGPAALDAARAFRPEIVLLDIGLPGLNGYEVARRLRKDLGLTDAVLVALTGWGQDEDRRLAREAGFDHHLVKPVDPQELRAELARPEFYVRAGP